MGSILRLLRRFQHLAFFILLEGIAITVYLQSDYLLKARAGFWLKEIEAWVEERMTDLSSYLWLHDQNAALVAENLALRNALAQQRLAIDYLPEVRKDTLHTRQYQYYSGTVVSNTVVTPHNYFTIDLGRNAAIRPEMPVLSGGSVAGMVLKTSEHYAVVISVLNTDFRLSAKLERTGYYGSLRWDGGDYRSVLLSEIPHHVEVRPGDTVVTTGFSNIFPPDLYIGVVDGVEVSGGDFNTIRVRLGCDFKRLHEVTLIGDTLKTERDSIADAFFRTTP